MINKKNNFTMKKWLSLHTIIIILIAVSATLFVEIIAVSWGDGNYAGGIKRSLGIIIPMCILLAGYNVFMFRSAYKLTNMMNSSIAKIAGGDFTVRLNSDNAKSMAEVFDNINIMTQELQNMAMMKNDFINTYSHEFKTPIASINGFAELLLTTAVTDDERQTYLQIIADESKRLADLADKTILLSRLDNQSIIDNKRNYSLDEQLRQCSILLSSQWTAKNINFSGDIDEVNYYGNEELMQQLWLNLMSNAIKFTPDGGEIFTTLSCSNGKISVSIRDNGIGMSDTHAARIFDKYYQAEVSAHKSGLGLGLSIAKRILDLCGGDISVTSAPNEGSCFTVQL